MDWQLALAAELDGGSVNVPLDDPVDVVCILFRDVIYPSLKAIEGRIAIPEQYTVLIGGGSVLFNVLSQPLLFRSLPAVIQKLILDTLHIILSRDVYDVVRLQPEQMLGSLSESSSWNKVLLKLLLQPAPEDSPVELDIQKRLLAAFGCSCSCGINPAEMKRLLSLLAKPSELSLALLQSLQMMLPLAISTFKSKPVSFFNFGGLGSGLVVPNVLFSFPKEYQVSFWFRVESFTEDSLMGEATSRNSNDNASDAYARANLPVYQQLMSWTNAMQQGIEVMIQGYQIVVTSVGFTKPGEATTVVVPDFTMERGVWYHFSLRQSKPKRSFFAKDELEITIDQTTIFTDQTFRYPTTGSQDYSVDFIFGRNFDGQMGPIYIFNEALPPSALASIARADAGKQVEDYTFGDLMTVAAITEKGKPPVLIPKPVMAFHPARCSNGWCLDIHGGYHASFCHNTFPWNCNHPRDVLQVIGGIAVLLPLFPRLLIENENVERYADTFDPVWGNGLGTSIAVYLQHNDHVLEHFDKQTALRLIKKLDFHRDRGVVSCLIEIFARAITDHATFQKDFLFMGGLEMIESALFCVHPNLLNFENEKCFESIMNLQQAANQNKELRTKISKLLLCNLPLWSAGSFALLQNLLQLILSSVRAGSNAAYPVGIEIRQILETIRVLESSSQSSFVRSRLNSASSRGENTVINIVTTNDNSPVLAPDRSSSSPAQFSPPKMMQQASSNKTPSKAFSIATDDSQPANGSATKTPKSTTSSSLRAKLRKTKSFKLAIAETLEGEDDDVTNEDENNSNKIGSAHSDSMHVFNFPSKLTSIQEDDQSYHEDEVVEVLDTPKVAEVFKDFPVSSTTTNDASLSPRAIMLQTQDEESQEILLSTFSNSEKKKLREYLVLIIAVMLLQDPLDQHIVEVIDYLCRSRDISVQSELVNLLTFLLDKGDASIAGKLVTAFHGLEEMLSFVISSLVHQADEMLRSASIRFIAQLSSKIDSITTAHLQLSIHKSQKMFSKLDLTMLKEASQRFFARDIMALFCEVVGSHCAIASIETYHATMSLLLSKAGVATTSASVNKGFVDPFAELSGSRSTDFGNQMLFAHDMDDESSEPLIITSFLPIVMELLPKFPLDVHDEIYTDLLGLVKHSQKNSDAFFACPSWHLCMYGMVMQLVMGYRQQQNDMLIAIDTADITELLLQKAKRPGNDSPSLVQKKSPMRMTLKRTVSGKGLENGLQSRWKQNIVRTTDATSSSLSLRFSSSVNQNSPFKNITDADVSFDLGMKIYSTVLVRCLEKKNGWHQVDQSISPSVDSEEGYLIAQSILSHFLNDITFNFKTKYKEIQRLAKSTNTFENRQAADRIENMLSIVLTVANVALLDCNCALGDLPCADICLTRSSTFSKLVENMDDDDDEVQASIMTRFKALSVNDQRKLLREVENTMRRHFTSPLPSCSATEEEGGINAFADQAARSIPSPVMTQQAHLDFSHTWAEMSSDSTSNTNGNGSAQSSLGNNDDTLLHPLERLHELKSGKLVLILQTLRFFDAIFWHKSNGPLKNVHMLRYSKEYGISDPFPSVTGSAPDDSMTIFAAVMRMGIYVMNHLSPTNAGSLSNLRRLRQVVQQMYKVFIPASTVEKWILVLLSHTVLHVQRLIALMKPIFKMIGMKNPENYFMVANIGPWDDSYDDYVGLDNDTNELIYTAMSDPQVLTDLEDYFEVSIGRLLLISLRNALHLLMDIFFLHSAFLSYALEERYYRALWMLVEQIKADVQVAVETAQDTESNKNTATATQNQTSDEVDVDLFVDDSDATSTTATAPATAASKDNRRMTMERNDSALGELNNPPMSPSPNNPATSTGGQSSQAGMMSPNHVQQNHDELMSDESQEYMDTATDGHSIVLTLKWILSPFFTMNVFRNTVVVRGLELIDRFEERAVYKFVMDLKIMKVDLEEHRDVAIKSVEGMAELKQLSREVRDIILDRSTVRANNHQSITFLKTKSVAARWHDCIRRFEDDWSPWSDPNAVNDPYTFNTNFDLDALDEDNASPAGVAFHQLGQHRDGKYRSMLLTKLPEPIDHRDAAYLEQKQKGQLEYLAAKGDSGAQERLGSSTTAAEAMNKVTKGMSILSMKLSRVDNDQKDPWSVGDNDNEDDDLVNNGSNSTASDGITSTTAVKNTLGLALNAAELIGSFFVFNDKRPAWTYMFSWAPDEKMMLALDGFHILPGLTIAGSVVLTSKCIYFHCKKRVGGLASTSQALVDRKWHLDRIVEVFGRRYLLQNSAMEFFFADAPELFLAFKNPRDLQRFHRHLKSIPLPMLITPLYLSPSRMYRAAGWTELWRRRIISNFEYLMRLNVLAGRSYNDITQYPVFPWILSDYHSNTLDLNDIRNYRPLNLPVGALNPSRLNDFIDRYQSFSEDEKKFMYGSHYSSEGVVLHFLIRQEPYTSMAINLQSGHFDCPDRIFFDVTRTWHGVNSSMSDVKELIPDLFCCPEVLINANKLSLGELQEGGIVNDVILPPWAGEDPYEFIRIHREALESDYVSDHLHEWIDLIFGCKQRGEAARLAHNVFYYLTYENATNIEAIKDPIEKTAVIEQVTHFGQTPSQLLTKEHPKRLPKEECALPLCTDSNSIRKIQLYSPSTGKQSGRLFGAVIAMQCVGEKLLVLHGNFNLCSYRWIASPDSDQLMPFTVKPDKHRSIPCVHLSYAENLMKGLHNITGSTQISKSTDATSSAGSILRSLTIDDNDPNDGSGLKVSDTGALQRQPSGLFGAFNRLSRGLQQSFTVNNNAVSNNSSAIASTQSAAIVASIPEEEQSQHNSKPLVKTRSQNGRASLYGETTKQLSGQQRFSTPPKGKDRSGGSSHHAASSGTKTTPRYFGRLTAASVSSATSSSGGQWTPLPSMTSKQVVVTATRCITCGYWDNTIKVHNLDSLKEVASVAGGHRGPITCLQLGSDEHTMVSGGYDGNLRVWVLEKASLAAALAPDPFYCDPGGNGPVQTAQATQAASGTQSQQQQQSQQALVCLHTLHGHGSPITAISYATDLDLVLSATSDGMLCTHTVRQGDFVRSIRHMVGASVDVVLATSPGYLLAHCWSTRQLIVCWLNGQLLNSLSVDDRIEVMISAGSSTSNVIVCGTAEGRVIFRDAHTLRELHRLTVPGNAPVRSLAFTEDGQFLMIGAQDGTYSIAADPESRMRLLSQAMQRTPLLG